MNHMLKQLSGYGIMFTALTISTFALSCEKMVKEDAVMQEQLSLISADQMALQLTDSVISESEIYQVFIDDAPVLTQKEICYDYESNGGKREIHTSLLTYQPGKRIKIVCDTTFDSYTISPQRLNLAVTHTGNEISFTAPSDYYNFIIDIPGKAPLFLSAAPDLSSYKSGAVVFGPGIHAAPNDEFILQSNTTYYLEEGAVLNGKVIIQNASNVKIFGRGYIDDRRSPVVGNLVKIYNSDNVEIKGIGIRHGALGWQTDLVNSKNVTMDFLNLLSFGQNNDGLDIGTGCEDVSFSHCLVGAGDDAFGWHATNAVAYGQNPLDRCNARECLVWQTAGCGIRIGNSLETTELKNVKFKNIDIAKSSQGIYSMAIPHSDWAHVHDVTFEDVHDERPNQDKFVLAYIKQTPSSNPVYQPGYISNIDFINCSSHASSAVFEGYDSTHTISNVKFKNVKVAGRDMVQSDVVANSYTHNIVVE